MTQHNGLPTKHLLLTLLAALAGESVGWHCRAEGLSPQDSVRHMKVADGFQVEVVAAEPLVRQPVAIEFDDRGRLWVIQYLQYPNPAGLKRIKVDRYSRTKYDRVPKPPPHGPRGRDRITILEDTDNDGYMDVGKDFVSGLNLATGIAFGHGGVFVLNVPYLLFYPDRDRNDIPDTDPQVLLSGFGMEDAHSVANSLTWGPDGWLYGCQGSTVTAKIRGIEFQQGVWRFHPVTNEFELFCEGGGNAWGLDFDATGNLFYSTNHGGHVLVHGVRGGYFTKSFAKHGELHNPHAYGYFDHAPHKNFHGGHVTVGGIVYQGDLFPESFRGTYVAADLLGHGVYWHKIERYGSTFRTAHGGELLTSNDLWFAPTDVLLGPDGAVYVSDWCDARTAHPDPDADWDRSNGRIFRISYGDRPNTESDGSRVIDFAQLGTEDLLALHRHNNQWWVRRARVELANRSRDPERSALHLQVLKEELLSWTSAADEKLALEALWTLAATGGIGEPIARDLLESPHSSIRSWVVCLIGDRGEISKELAHCLTRFAAQETAVQARQQLASTAKRLPARQAVPIIDANIVRDVDNDDPFLPLLWWWAVEHHSVRNREEVLKLFVRSTIWKSKLGRSTLLPRLIRRYAAEGSPADWDSVERLLAAAPSDDARRPLWDWTLAGWKEQGTDDSVIARSHAFSCIVLRGWTQSPDDLSLTQLAVMLGHQRPLAVAQQDAFDDAVDVKRRVALLGILADTQQHGLIQPALALLSSGESEPVRRAALELLSHFESESVASELMELLAAEDAAALRTQIREILLSRRSSARVLLAAVQRGHISANSIPFEQIRRVALLHDAELNSIVVKHWGSLRPPTPGEKLAEVRRLNNDLRAGSGNLAEGKKLFTQHCASCHTLFGEGTKLGPDLTSANRSNRDFLLVSLVDPDNVIRKEYMSVVVRTSDGRVLTGLPVARDLSGVTLVDGKSSRRFTIATSDIDEIHESPVSLMPSNLYRQLNPQQLRDLFRYLQSQTGE